MDVRRRKHNRKIIIILSIFLLSSTIGFGSWFLLQQRQKPTPIESQTENIPEPPIPQPVTASSRLLFTGTTFWGRRTNAAAMASESPYEFPFAQLNTLHRENYQAWIGNLECPVTNTEHTKSEEENLLLFNCNSAYLPEVSKYFTAFSLGTNHSDNWGDEGIEKTKQNLTENNIQYFGHYRYDNSTENCNIISIPIKITYDNGEIKDSNIPIAFCSAHGVFGIPTIEARNNIEKYASILPTIVMPHMGAEYKASADQLRTNLFRGMIDQGAEMILADHPHWVQNTESYNGKLIAYSMGNFMFDQQGAETVLSAAIDVTANLDKTINFDTWNEIAIFCKENHGNCLEKIQDSNLEKLTISWTNYDFVATNNKGFQTHLATDAERQQISSRLNWETTLQNLTK